MTKKNIFQAHGKDYFRYDLLRAYESGNIFERLFHYVRVQTLLGAIDYREKRILDVGCNTGVVLIPFTLHGYNVVGVDNNPSHIARARRNLRQRSLDSRVVRVANARKLPFQTNTFDVVLLSDILEHTSEPEITAKEALRVVKRGGVVLATVPFYLHPVVRYDWIRKLLTGRKDVDKFPDVAFTLHKLIGMFPNTHLRKWGLVYFWSSILGIFEKL